MARAGSGPQLCLGQDGLHSVTSGKRSFISQIRYESHGAEPRRQPVPAWTALVSPGPRPASRRGTAACVLLLGQSARSWKGFRKD